MDGQQPTEPKKELTEEDIKKLDGNTRATLCMNELNVILNKYNCVYNPVLTLSNHGHQIDVHVIGLAYAAPMMMVFDPSRMN